MKMIVAIIRPEKCREVKDALRKAGIGGMTITHVTGHGKQAGLRFTNRVGEFIVDEIDKTKIEIVLEDESVLDGTIQTIIRSAYTGHHGDGRIFVLPVERSYIISDHGEGGGAIDG